MITIGLDAGTTTIGAAVVDSETGTVLATRTLPNKSQLKTDSAWENLQDADIIWKTCQSLLVDLLAVYPDIAGIGLTGQMHGILYTDEDGQAVRPLFTWQDGRGEQPYQHDQSYAGCLSDRTNYHMATGFGLTTHFYNLRNGLVPDGAICICTIADYIGMQLTGRKQPLLHTSNAHSLGMFDLTQMRFDEEALSIAEIFPEMLPEIAPGETVIGRTKDGIPVWTAIGDNQASFLGAAGENYDVVANIGTSSQLSVRSGTLVEAEGLDIRPHVRGEYLLVGAGLCGGSAYALLHSLLKEVLEMYGVETNEDRLYDMMERAAQKEIHSGHTLAIDTRFRGTRLEPQLRGAISQIGINNFSVGHLALGVMRGICDELGGFYEKVPEALRKAEVLVGGGNSQQRNKTLRALLAERFEMRIILSPHHEEAAIGASRVAAR